MHTLFDLEASRAIMLASERGPLCMITEHTNQEDYSICTGKRSTPRMHIATKPQVIINTPSGSKSLLMKMMTCLPSRWMDGWMGDGAIFLATIGNDVRRHGR